MKLVGNTAIVTGGNRGIGLGIAKKLMEYGANVVISGRDEETGNRIAEELTDTYDTKAYFVKCDVRKAEDVKNLIEKSVELMGNVYILCNNAGINPEYTRTWDQTEEVWDAVIDTDLKGPFLCMREIIPYWIENKIPGCIINTSSINYNCATDGMIHYCAAKAGLSHMSKTVAGEAGRYGIRVNSIAPGLVITEMSEGFAQGEILQEFKERSPLYLYDKDKFCQVEDCGNVAVFLASDLASWITGETIAVDGGNHIRGLHSYYDFYARAKGLSE